MTESRPTSELIRDYTAHGESIRLLEFIGDWAVESTKMKIALSNRRRIRKELAKRGISL
jgi:hypothetical protein